jgi:hypothetical protein
MEQEIPFLELFKCRTGHNLLSVKKVVNYDYTRSVMRYAITISSICKAHYIDLTNLFDKGVTDEDEMTECRLVFEGYLIRFINLLLGRRPSDQVLEIVQHAILRGFNMFATSLAYVAGNALAKGTTQCETWMLTPVWMSQFCCAVSKFVSWHSDLRCAQTLIDALCYLIDMDTHLMRYADSKVSAPQQLRTSSSRSLAVDLKDTSEAKDEMNGTWLGYARLLDAYALCRLFGTLLVDCEMIKDISPPIAKLASGVKRKLIHDCVSPLFFACFRYALHISKYIFL